MRDDSPTLETWLAELRAYADSAASTVLKRVWSFPDEAARDEFVATAGERPDAEFDLVLRHLLMPSCATPADHSRLASARATGTTGGDPHFRRIEAFYANRSDQPPWAGIRWVLDLLPDHPHSALQATEAYLVAHAGAMPPAVAHATDDAEALIRARYIGLPGSVEARRELLGGLGGRELSRLAGSLYPGQAVECRPLRVGVDVVRSVLAATGECVVVTASTFTRAAEELAGKSDRVTLVAGAKLVGLLDEHLGWDWPLRLEHLTREPVGAAG
ncbi:restriction endonuclease [Amycolatopsis solani]|uniref:restriction endonuclease n=1 Tax=Amycolatopsis solani TaxID=3028615 RepID=UPI0025AFD33B|nr:restriction endonuclease [Amycolatopsis sp. MEP2-6]